MPNASIQRPAGPLPPLRSALVAGVVLALASAVWVHDSHEQRQSRLAAQATQAGEARAQALAAALEHHVSVLDVLAALVTERGGEVPRFEQVAAQLLRDRPGIHALGLLPQGVVAQVAPPSYGHHLRGRNLLQGPHANADAQRAVQEGRRWLSAPTRLLVGKPGVVAYQPVHLLPSPTVLSEPRFWGLVRAGIDLGELLRSGGLDGLQAQGFAHRLWGPDGQLLHGAPTDTEGTDALEQPLTVPVRLYNQVWQLQLSPLRGWVDPWALGLQVGWAALFSLAGAGLVYLLLNNIRLARGTLRQLASQVPGVLYQYHRRPDGHTWFSYISPGMTGLTGLAPEALRQSDAEWRQRIWPEDRPALLRAMRQSAQALEPLQAEFRFTLTGGGQRWLRTRALPQRQPDGTVTWNGYLADWTQEKHTAEALLQSNHLLAEAQEVARLGYFITDVSSGTWTSSPLLDQLFGIDERFERTARAWVDLVEPEHRTALRQAYHLAVMQRTGFNVEYSIRRPSDDRVVWVQAMGRLEFDDQGQPVRVVGTVQDITARKKAEADIRSLAYYDPLTGLPNRRLLLDRLAQALQARGADGAHGALMFIDLDHFKDLNDTLGHDKGDALLRMVALRLLACVREEDTVSRLGGDEFVLLLSRLALAPGDDPARVAEDLGLKVVAALGRPYPLGETLLTSTPSIGVALFAHEGLTVDEVLKRADVAMYQAKAAGRNTLRFYDPAIQAELAERMQLAEDLRGAVLAGQLRLVYQPQHDDTGRLVGAEALLRWQHPERGAMSPAVFIPLAEQVGLMVDLGQWVLNEACQQLRTWLADPVWAQRVEPHFALAVNVSAHQFHSPGFVADVGRALAQAGLPTRTLKLELTESLMVQDVEDIIAKMNALRPLGVLFSLDDFGTGYSSLTYLKRLPLDQLKIDQSFVRDVQTSTHDAAIARTVVALGQTLGLDVIAEGVETEAQRAFLRELGCHSYQGYLFSRPLESESFRAYALAE